MKSDGCAKYVRSAPETGANLTHLATKPLDDPSLGAPAMTPEHTDGMDAPAAGRRCGKPR
jgi:hypothetical protein